MIVGEPKLLYFSVNHAIKEHDKILVLSGGRSGILNQGLLESVLHFVKNDEYYPDVHTKLTHLVHSIAMNHCFVDGNKRSAIALGAYFLEINGMDNIVPAFLYEMENVVLWVAKGYIAKELLAKIIRSLINDSEIAESIKLEIADILREAA